MKKKILSLLTALIMVLPLFPIFEVPVFAAPVYTTSVSKTKITPGEEVTVTVFVNEKVTVKGFALDYSAICGSGAPFELVSADFSSTIKSNSMLAVPQHGNGQAASAAMSSYEVSGEIFTLKVKAKESAELGTYVFDIFVKVDAVTATTKGTTVEICHKCVPATTYSNDATHHWMKCSICGIIVEDTRKAHDFDNACDTTCNTCGFTRTVTHDYSVQDKDENSHWMKCSICGKIDEDTRKAHDFDNACDTTCNTCGFTRQVSDHVYDSERDHNCNECGFVRFIPGELDGNEGIDIDDAIYALFAVNYPDQYPVNQPIDFDRNGKVEIEDAFYLLFHYNFPDLYPLY